MGAMFLSGEDSVCLEENPRLSPFLPKGEGGGGGGLLGKRAKLQIWSLAM